MYVCYMLFNKYSILTVTTQRGYSFRNSPVTGLKLDIAQFITLKSEIINILLAYAYNNLPVYIPYFESDLQELCLYHSLLGRMAVALICYRPIT